VRVRLKNKGAKKKSGRPRKKYQAPVPEHPETEHVVNDKDIHANHVEAFNASLRRRNSAFRRKTNTYAKSRNNLQRTLDLYWLVHNFVRGYWFRRMWKQKPSIAKVTTLVERTLYGSSLT